MKYLPILLLLTSCAVHKPQNWNDDKAMQKEFKWITDGRTYSWQGDTLTIEAER